MVIAEPDFRAVERISGVQVIGDHEEKYTYYYAPAAIEMAVESDGRPAFQLVSTRYTGTVATNDQYEARDYNLVSFDIRLRQPTVVALDAVTGELRRRSRGRKFDLRPISINRLVNTLVYAPAHDPEVKTSLIGENLEAEDKPDLDGDPEHPNDGVWARKTFNIKISSEDAQLLSMALGEGQVLISVSYAILAKGVPHEAALVDVSGSPELLDLVQQNMVGARPDRKDGFAIQTIAADTLAVSLDLAEWPEVISRIDLNEQMPANYPMLWVRSYDFQDGLADSLYMKRVQVEAMSIDDFPVQEEVRFTSAHPEQTAKRIKFDVAIRLDRPFRYRTLEVYEDGRQAMPSDWLTGTSWMSTLDVTRPFAPIEESEEVEE